MNLSTETSSHRNNTSTIQTRTIPKTSKQTHNKKKKKKKQNKTKQNTNTNIHENETQNMRYEVRK